MLETRTGPQQGRPLHNASELDGLLINKPLSLNFLNKLHESLVALVVLQVVRIQQDLHFVLKVLFQRVAVHLRRLYQRHGLLSPLFLHQLSLDGTTDLLLIGHRHERLDISLENLAVLLIILLAVEQLTQMVVYQMHCPRVQLPGWTPQEQAPLLEVSDSNLASSEYVDAQIDHALFIHFELQQAVFVAVTLAHSLAALG